MDLKLKILGHLMICNIFPWLLAKQEIQGLFSNQYFRMHEKNKEIPSYFEYEIAKNNKLYSYGFEVNIK